MGKHRDFADKDIFYASWTDAIQEWLSDFTQNFKLVKATSTAVAVVPASGERISIGLHGPWRYRDTEYSLTISGSAGTKTIWAVAPTANDFVGAGNDPDDTDYKFELRMTTGGTPESVAYYRKVGEVGWSGSAITWVKQTAGPIVGTPQIDDAAVTSPKMAPTSGLLYTPGTLVLTTSYQDMTSLEFTVSPVVASKLVVTLVPYFWVQFAHAYATLHVDGVAQAQSAILSNISYAGPLLATVAQVYQVSLSAGTHTIIPKAKRETGLEATAARCEPGSSLIYTLYAA